MWSLLFVEAAVALAQGGYGATCCRIFFRTGVLDFDMFRSQMRCRSGVYDKALAGRPLRKTFVQLLKERISAMEEMRG